MIIGLIVSSVLGGIVVLLVQPLLAHKKIGSETARKVVHIAHGLVVAAWVFFVGYYFIIAAEVLFLAVVLLARRFNILQSLRSVNRKSWGEVFFPLGVIAIAPLAPSKWVFLAAVLHLGLADALAALVGRRFKKGEYYILGQRKTVAGSGTFFIISLLIILWLVSFSHAGYLPPDRRFTLLFIPLIMTLTENYSPYGSDNFTLPLLAVCCLKLITA